eukprot:gene5134-gene5676
MPYQFEFNVNDEVYFQCVLNSVRCSGHTKAGTRCKRKCIIPFEYCPAHLKSTLHLIVKPSSIPNSGKGVYVAGDPNEIVFRKNDRICSYDGEILSTEEINNRYTDTDLTAPYAVNTQDNVNVDCACKRSIGSLINNRPGHNNVNFSWNAGMRRLSIKASKNIRGGQELFLAYG